MELSVISITISVHSFWVQYIVGWAVPTESAEDLTFRRLILKFVFFMSEKITMIKIPKQGEIKMHTNSRLYGANQMALELVCHLVLVFCYVRRTPFQQRRFIREFVF